MALAGFQIISPIGGAVFGTAILPASYFGEKGLNKFFGKSASKKMIKCIGNLFLSTVAGTALVNYGFGVSLSMVHAVSLTGAIVITSGITSLGFDSIKAQTSLWA